MIEELNYDCQLLIIAYLELKDQLALWEATAHIPSSRLNATLIYSWQHKLSYVLDEEVLDQFEENPKQSDGFLCAISGTVQHLDLQFIKTYQLQKWIGHSFPCMRELCFTVNDSCQPVGSLVLQLLVELFPKLNAIKPWGTFYSEITEKWTQLQRLDLTECCPPIEHISMCKFQQLEQITVHSGFLTHQFIDSLLALPNLRAICFHAEERIDEVLNIIIDKRAEHIERLSFNDSIWFCTQETLQRAKNVRQLSLIEDDGFQRSQLETLLSNLPLLKQLDLINFQIWRSESELWQAVGRCDSLQILNISGMQLYNDFFEFSRRPMETVLGKRSNPLILYCNDTGDCKERVNGNDFSYIFFNNK